MVLIRNMICIPLLVKLIQIHLVESRPSQEVATALEDGELGIYSNRHFGHLMMDLAAGMGRRRVSAGNRVATLAWNTHHHLRTWYATSAIGAICRTVIPRLSLAQIDLVINDAQDDKVFYDGHVGDLANTLKLPCQSVADWVLLPEKVINIDHMPMVATGTICETALRYLATRV